MRTIEEIHAFRAYRSLLQTKSVGFVPTMGALHQGHAELVRRARKEMDHVIVSIFINPTQFNHEEDLDKYPRTLEKDLKLLEELGVDVVFTPQKEAMYPDEYNYHIAEKAISSEMEGAHRPGHFEGMLTIVLKLLLLVQPRRAYFGEKDYQQYLLIKGMAHAFFLDTEIIPCPTVREPSGLALSSRNTRLTAEQREKAAEIYQALTNEKDLESATRRIAQAGFDVEYVQEAYGRRFAACSVDGVRLIDNVSL